MATQGTQQGVAQSTSQGSGSLKAKYIEALQKNVVDPLRRDLEQRQQSLRSELQKLGADGGDRRALLQRKLEQLGRVSNTLDTELARLQKLHLSDFA